MSQQTRAGLALVSHLEPVTGRGRPQLTAKRRGVDTGRLTTGVGSENPGPLPGFPQTLYLPVISRGARERGPLRPPCSPLPGTAGLLLDSDCWVDGSPEGNSAPNGASSA